MIIQLNWKRNISREELLSNKTGKEKSKRCFIKKEVIQNEDSWKRIDYVGKIKTTARSIAISNVANGNTVSSYEHTNSKAIKHSGKEQRVRKSICQE